VGYHWCNIAGRSVDKPLYLKIFLHYLPSS
jgi:hypothetical protein